MIANATAPDYLGGLLAQLNRNDACFLRYYEIYLYIIPKSR